MSEMSELAVLLSALREAGAAILATQRSGFAIQIKANKDIVTQADLQVDAILKKRLLTAFPQDGWLSEESMDDKQRLTCKRVWVVDPIDGTREFARGVPEYAISVALVENGEPVLAAVYNPAAGELYHAIKGGGAWQGEARLQCRIKKTSDELVILASRSEYARGEWNQFAKEYTVKQVGSIAYKMALIAAGKAHATFSLGPKNEWDIAAGVLLVTEAGGIVTDKTGNNISFNSSNTRVNGVVATTAAVNVEILSRVNSNSLFR